MESGRAPQLDELIPGGEKAATKKKRHRFHRCSRGQKLCTTNLKILAKKKRIFRHHGMTVGVGIGIGVAIAVAIAIENCA